MHSLLITTNDTRRRKGLSLRGGAGITRGAAARYARLRQLSGNKRNQGPIKGAHSERTGARITNSAGLSPEVEAIERRVQALSDDQLLGRYHDLVDRRLDGAIRYTELFELDRIEARLNMSEQDEIDRMAVLRDEWRRERDAIVTSIDSLLSRFRAPR
jgi:hypothetical protein